MIHHEWQTQISSSAGCTFHPDGKRGALKILGSFIVEGDTVSPTSFSASFLSLPSYIPQSSPYNLSWCTFFLVDDKADGLKFWTLWWMAHKLHDDKITTFTILDWFHEEVKQASIMLTGNLYLCLVVLTCWVMFLFVKLM